MPNSCIGCGYCLSHCPQEAVFLDEKRIRIQRSKCTRCMACSKFCFAGALKAVAKEMTAAEVMAEVVQDLEFYRQTGGGMTISGGELLSQADFAEALLTEAAKNNIAVCLDTSGFGDGERLLHLAKQPHVTDILYDMKAFDDAVHTACTGQSNRLILDNLRMLAQNAQTGPKIRLRMPLIRDVNDMQSLIEATAAFCREYGIQKATLLPYHNLGVSKMRNIGGTAETFEAPNESRLSEIRHTLEAANLQVEILGRV